MSPVVQLCTLTLSPSPAQCAGEGVFDDANVYNSNENLNPQKVNNALSDSRQKL
jgi:hypothetical protein